MEWNTRVVERLLFDYSCRYIDDFLTLTILASSDGHLNPILACESLIVVPNYWSPVGFHGGFAFPDFNKTKKNIISYLPLSPSLSSSKLPEDIITIICNGSYRYNEFSSSTMITVRKKISLILVQSQRVLIFIVE